MSNAPLLEISDFLTGPDLLLRNAFRLAQMPVDATERKLNKRQYMIDMGRKMGMSFPKGSSPIFAIESSSEEDALKEALHRMRDPMNRLLDELFWFWPRTFGDSENDEGLKLLSENKIEEAWKFWKRGEKETENYISTHNLALLHQFLALQIDVRMISNKASLAPDGIGRLFGGTNKEEKTSRKHWREALTRWTLLAKQELFWDFLKDRIRSINHPGLPVESGDWFRENIFNILLSVNIGLIISAAKASLSGHVERQWKILGDSKCDSENIRMVSEALTHQYRRKIRQLCSTAKNDTINDPIRGYIPARRLAEQATPVLNLLSGIFPNGNKVVGTLHDEVAETILECQVKFGNKTENWTESAQLLKLAEPIVRGEAAKTRINDNIKRVEQNENAGNNWCEKGYFDLPEPCIEVLDRARAYEGAQQYMDAIDLLRKALLGIIELPFHSNFRKHLNHCIAYTFKSKSVIEFNRAITEFEQNIKKILFESLTCDGYIGESSGTCASCKSMIIGDYVNRTIGEHIFPFCLSCSARVDQKLKGLEPNYNKKKNECLNLIVIAYAFDSDCKAVTRNLKIIREDGQGSYSKEENPKDLKIKWNLIDPKESIDLLAEEKTSASDVLTIFKNLSRTLFAQCATEKERTLEKMFSEVTKNGRRLLYLLPHFKKDAPTCPVLCIQFDLFFSHKQKTRIY